jgi:hypothetical protein
MASQRSFLDKFDFGLVTYSNHLERPLPKQHGGRVSNGDQMSLNNPRGGHHAEGDKECPTEFMKSLFHVSR